MCLDGIQHVILLRSLESIKTSNQLVIVEMRVKIDSKPLSKLFELKSNLI